tara:strand:- start:579 stop:1262 length:684 start_codon:yes stop_codon:yes gene_type:complete
MKFLFLFIFLFSCSGENSEYFPLKKNSWTYRVEIIPEVEKKILYKKTNTSVGGKKIKVKGKEKNVFPVLREDGTTFYYEISKDGIYRNGVRYLKDKKINFDKKRLVLPKPIKLNKKWSNDSKTFLILRRYPYYDYKATTNFQINYKITSINQIVTTPYGTFNDCILVEGEGQTNFIGDSEIGSIGIKITSQEWYSKKAGLVKMIREEATDTDLFGTTRMIQLLETYK